MKLKSFEFQYFLLNIQKVKVPKSTENLGQKIVFRLVLVKSEKLIAE